MSQRAGRVRPGPGKINPTWRLGGLEKRSETCPIAQPAEPGEYWR